MGPTSQPLVALSCVAFTCPDLTHSVTPRKYLADQLNVKVENIFVWARSIWSDIPD